MSRRDAAAIDRALRVNRFEDAGAMVEMVETLENGSRTAPADQSAADLGVPTLDDVDRTLLGLMRCAAENGQIGCD